MNKQPTDPQHIENLILEYFDGVLSPQQEKELAAELTSSTQAQATFLNHMRMEGRLHSLGRDGFLQAAPQAPIFVSQEPKHHASRFQHLFAATSSIAVCAAVVLIFTTWILTSTSVNASTVLSRAKRAAEDSTDRQYEITISKLRFRGSSQGRKLTMTVRGGGRFVLKPHDGRYVMGSDGTDYWLAFDEDTVWVTDNFRTLAPEMQRHIPDRSLLEIAAAPEEPLLLKLDSLLSLIERRYSIKLVESNEANLHRMRATLRKQFKSGPDSIELWSNRSGVIQRAELTWPGERVATFELVDSLALSSQWYRHHEHVEAEKTERLFAD